MTGYLAALHPTLSCDGEAADDPRVMDLPRLRPSSGAVRGLPVCVWILVRASHRGSLMARHRISVDQKRQQAAQGAIRDDRPRRQAAAPRLSRS